MPYNKLARTSQPDCKAEGCEVGRVAEKFRAKSNTILAFVIGLALAFGS